ncbi:MAG: adenine phosphoribosyltransferase [Patescibacteria group bacterium]|nr:adenine phosphoribosyltransferase [Patescibacteria group bacterium]
MINKFENKIRSISDWPQKGVNFRDITPVLQDKKMFRDLINELAKPYLKKKIDIVVAIDARGFLLAAPVAYKLGAGVALVRKKGKLPYKTISTKYDLEYASNILEMHRDAILPGQRVLLVDDVLATGGTMEASIKLAKQLGGKIIGAAFFIELKALNGKKKLKNCPITSLVKY